jgi:hypothetical protein
VTNNQVFFWNIFSRINRSKCIFNRSLTIGFNLVSLVFTEVITIEIYGVLD